MVDKEMCDKVNATHDRVITMQKDIEYIKKALEGNGKKGLIDEVDGLKGEIGGIKEWKTYLTGALAVVVFIVVFLLNATLKFI